MPDEENIAKKIILESSSHDLLNGVLCHEDVNYPGSWRIVIPLAMRSTLLEKLHGGKFSGHFAWKKLYNSRTKLNSAGEIVITHLIYCITLYS